MGYAAVVQRRTHTSTRVNSAGVLLHRYALEGRYHQTFRGPRKQQFLALATQELTVVGGGAAGLTAAYFAAKSGANVSFASNHRVGNRSAVIWILQHASFLCR